MASEGHMRTLRQSRKHPVRRFSHLCWQVSRLADSGVAPCGFQPSHGCPQWLQKPFRSRSRGRLRFGSLDPVAFPLRLS